MESEKLSFELTLDLPETYDGPWTDDYNFDEYEEFFEYFRYQNFENALGYARSTTGGEPTESKEQQHLIVLNNAYKCRLHIQIHKENLRKTDFSKVLLSSVDFD